MSKPNDVILIPDFLVDIMCTVPPLTDESLADIHREIVTLKTSIERLGKDMPMIEEERTFPGGRGQLAEVTRAYVRGEIRVQKKYLQALEQVLEDWGPRP